MISFIDRSQTVPNVSKEVARIVFSCSCKCNIHGNLRYLANITPPPVWHLSQAISTSPFVIALAFRAMPILSASTRTTYTPSALNLPPSGLFQHYFSSEPNHTFSYIGDGPACCTVYLFLFLIWFMLPPNARDPNVTNQNANSSATQKPIIRSRLLLYSPSSHLFTIYLNDENENEDNIFILFFSFLCFFFFIFF